MVYYANPNVSVDISGRFEKPNDPDDIGQIKIMKMYGGEGKVTCRAAN